MKQQQTSSKMRVLLTTVALGAAVVAAAPQAEANSGAGGTILNTITVNYKDASGTTSYSASAASKVTINVVKAAVTVSGMPTPSAKGVSAALPTGQTVNSGATATYLLAITANANGNDTYNLSRAIGSLTNIAAGTQSVTWSTVANNGSTELAANPATVDLGASVIQGNTANTISIPGGSTTVAKIQTNAAGSKVLVVNGVDYIVTNITLGTAPNNSNIGAGAYNTVGTATAEAPAVITLAANPNGANVAPAFTADALIGSQVGEQVLVKVSVTGAVGATVGTAGVIPFTFTVTDGAGGNSVTTASITTTFSASNLQIKKSVRNCGQATAVGVCGTGLYAATATGNPGDILEYKVEVTNPAGSSPASLVSAQDAVPAYTSLVSFTNSTYGDGGSAGTGLGTQYFAQITDGTTTGSLTIQGTDTDVTNVGAGDAAGTAANSAIHFFLGSGVSNNAGGSIAAGKTYTIYYRMKMN